MKKNCITSYTIDLINEFKEDCNEYSCEKSKDNKSVLKVKRNGKQVYMGSKYSVNRDIEYFLNQLNLYTSLILLNFSQHLLA